MDKQKLLELASKLLLASATNRSEEIEVISDEIAATLRQRTNENGDREPIPPPSDKDREGFLKFTSQEISKMSTQFRKTFRANGCLVHVRRRKRGKYGYDYEARYRRDGYNISVSSKDFEELKPKFIETVNRIDSGETFPQVPSTFHEFATYYFDTFWQRKVTAETYKSEMYRYKRNIQPFFGSIPLKRITPQMCQQFIDGIVNAGHGKTADEVYGRLNQIFDTAIKHNLITHNPLDIVVFIRHEREHGKALTKSEELHLLESTAGTPYQLMFAVALYTGMRPNEYATARIEGGFIIAVNSKRKTRKIEYKKIPITPMLRPYLNGVQELRFYIPNRMRDKLHKILPAHTLKDLRTTFNTRCEECGVLEVARKKFMGHSLGALGNAYTDLSDDFLLNEGEKLKY